MTNTKTFGFKSLKYQATVFGRDDEGKIFSVGVVAAIIVMEVFWKNKNIPSLLLNAVTQTLTEPEKIGYSL